MASICYEYRTSIESQLKALNDVESVQPLLLAFIQALGFTDFDFSYIDESTNNRVFLWSSLDREFIGQYLEAGLGEYDLVLEYLLENDQPLYLYDLNRFIESAPFKLMRMEKTKSIRDMFAKRGYSNGLILPLYDDDRPKAVLSIFVKWDSPEHFRKCADAQLGKLELIGKCAYRYAFLRLAKVVNCHNHRDVSSLTKRELEILGQYLKCEFSAQRVASALSRSKFTIHKHTENIRKKLNVKTTHEAVILGVKQGRLRL